MKRVVIWHGEEDPELTIQYDDFSLLAGGVSFPQRVTITAPAVTATFLYREVTVSAEDGEPLEIPLPCEG